MKDNKLPNTIELYFHVLPDGRVGSMEPVFDDSEEAEVCEYNGGGRFVKAFYDLRKEN